MHAGVLAYVKPDIKCFECVCVHIYKAFFVYFLTLFHIELYTSHISLSLE